MEEGMGSKCARNENVMCMNDSRNERNPDLMVEGTERKCARIMSAVQTWGGVNGKVHEWCAKWAQSGLGGERHDAWNERNPDLVEEGMMPKTSAVQIWWTNRKDLPMKWAQCGLVEEEIGMCMKWCLTCAQSGFSGGRNGKETCLTWCPKWAQPGLQSKIWTYCFCESGKKPRQDQ